MESEVEGFVLVPLVFIWEVGEREWFWHCDGVNGDMSYLHFR